MMKDWVKGNNDSWHLSKGIELDGYGSKTKYPFIQIGIHYDSKHGVDDGFEVMRHGSNTSTLLFVGKTKAQAVKFAKEYMKTHTWNR
jgi:hypothetical protein